jgi:gas vesicle protein
MTDYERFGEDQIEDQSSEQQAVSSSGWGLGVTMLLIGLGAGALTALLFAPRSGRLTRRMLRRKYEDAVDTINERADEWKERGAGWAETARGWMGSAKDAADNVSDRIRPVVREAKRK